MKLEPKIKLPVNYFIEEQLQEQRLRLDVFLDKNNLTINEYEENLIRKESISIEFAGLLAENFNTSIQYWINLDKIYKNWKLQLKS